MQKLCLLACLLLSLNAYAIPQLLWDEVNTSLASGNPNSGEIDLRTVFEASVLHGVTQTNQQALDPAQLWELPADQFNPSTPNQKWSLKNGDRFVARFQLLSEKTANDVMLSVNMARLDAVHVSYRYGKEPWVHMRAGDTIAMQEWTTPDLIPTFAIPVRPGSADVVIQIVHRGSILTNFLLQTDNAHHGNFAKRNWLGGVLTGAQFIVALLAVLFAIILRQSALLSVSLSSLLMLSVLISNSGFLGLFLPESNNTLNDQLKFLTLHLHLTNLPLTALALFAARRRTPKIWAGVVIYSALMSALGLWLMQYENRFVVSSILPGQLLISIVTLLMIVSIGLLLQIRRPPILYIAIVCFIISVIAPFGGILGLFDSNWAGISSSGLNLMGSLCAIGGLYTTHRLGRQVAARAEIASTRDPLTGLLNRAGFDKHFKELETRLHREPYCGLLCFVSLADAQYTQNEIGYEGFETSMVRMAATLSTGLKGIEEVSRITPNGFALTTLTSPDAVKATRLAQTILTRSMVLASQGAQMAGNVRIVLCWLPLYGMNLNALQARINSTLASLSDTKRIAWVGGQESTYEMEAMIARERQTYLGSAHLKEVLERNKEISSLQSSSSQPLQDRIRSIEQEMLDNVDTAFLIAEAERMSDQINTAHAAQLPEPSANPVDDFEKTLVLNKPILDQAPTEPTPKAARAPRPQMPPPT